MDNKELIELLISKIGTTIIFTGPVNVRNYWSGKPLVEEVFDESETEEEEEKEDEDEEETSEGYTGFNNGHIEIYP